jgi:hypothetical protein
MRLPILPITIALFLFACSDKTGEQTGVQDFPNTLQASTQTALFDLPSSLQDSAPQVQVQTATAPLARIAAGSDPETDQDKIDAFKPYLAVPAYIHLAEEAKRTVQSFIHDLSKQELPPDWEGQVDSLYIKTRVIDTTIGDIACQYYKLVGTRNDTTIISLKFLRSDSGQYRGHFFLYNVADHHIRIRVDFDGIKTGGEQRMTVNLRRDSIALPDQNDPTIIRVRAIKRTNGKIVVTGSSYHPTFADEFWGESPKIYGFQAVSHPEKDRTVLRVAFADADSVDDHFFTKYSLDQAILNRVTAALRQDMKDSSTKAKLIFFCLDSNIAANKVFTAEYYSSFINYTPTRTPDDFTPADLEKFLDLNRESILNRQDDMGGLRGLYFLVKIKQPLFLIDGARIVGAGPDGAPAGFPLSPTSITDEGLEGESPAGFQNDPIED